ncbi:MAG: HEAT repeat domain-containing protein [Planctomycetes bacterium]|nr:HEAT repeat domain-containing protein [Planctomycetota bacterium]
MACSFHRSLLAAVVALVVAGQVAAQSELKEAVNAIRLGKSEEAKTILRGVLTSDPSNEQALQLYESVSQDEWYMLLTEQDGDIRKIAQSILERAKVERREHSRDEGTIQSLVDTATAEGSTFGDRQDAINKLIADHGEFAVPALVRKLANADDVDGQIRAIYALSQLDTVAVLPLIEVLESSDELTVQNAAAALHHIGDMRAAPAMAHLANDSRVGVATIAKKFLAQHNVSGNAVELLLAQAKSYLKGEIPAGGYSDVVWSLQDDKLVATDVPALVYPAELAKECAADAVAIAPQDASAISMLAQANLAQANLIETSIAQGDEAAAGLADVVPELKIAAQATGLDALRAALDAGVKQGLVPVAVGAIDALAVAEGASTIATDQALVRALDSQDKRIQYAAAAALVEASHGVNVPAADKVAGILAQAVTEQAVHTIQVISPDEAARDAVAASNSVRGLAVEASSNAVAGMRDLLVNPNIDVVVINEILPDRLPEDIIGNLKKDARMANTRVVIVAKDTDAAQERFGDAIQGVVQAPLTGESLVAEVNRVLEGATNPAGERAEGYAAKASRALQMMATGKAAVGSALGDLAKQLDRGDAVAVPAAQTIGLAGSADQLPALRDAIERSSDAVKVAAADAIGNILARMDAAPAETVATLVAVVNGDGDVALRAAAARALGKAKLDARQKADVQLGLRRIAGVRSEG